MDRNDYYGGESASLNLTNVCFHLQSLFLFYAFINSYARLSHTFKLYKKFREGMSPPAQFGKDRDYNVDLIPKFAMASGEFTNILYHTDVTRYMEFRQIEGSFVFRDGRISKV